MAPPLLGAVWLLTAATVLAGYLCLTYTRYLPGLARRLYLFGKLREKTKTTSRWMDLPKRWFRHFYVIGILTNTAVLVLLALTVLRLALTPPLVLTVVSWFCYPVCDQGAISLWTVVLVILLYELHIARRLYECCYISVFSNSTISPVHYIAGLALYPAFSLATAAGLLVGQEIQTASVVEVAMAVLGVLLFSWGTVVQHNSMRILASLRKSSSGSIMDRCHHLPVGGLFEVVSCPQYLGEVAIYLGLCLVLGLRHPNCLCITVFVVANQLASALMTHTWYQKTFPKYPRHRSAILPWIL